MRWQYELIVLNELNQLSHWKYCFSFKAKLKLFVQPAANVPPCYSHRYYIYKLPKNSHALPPWMGDAYYFLSNVKNKFTLSTSATGLTNPTNPLAKTLSPVYQKGKVTSVIGSVYSCIAMSFIPKFSLTDENMTHAYQQYISAVAQCIKVVKQWRLATGRVWFRSLQDRSINRGTIFRPILILGFLICIAFVL